MARKLRNVTITLDEETARWARIEAARQDVSVSGLIAELLKEHMQGPSAYEAAQRRYFQQQPLAHHKPRQKYPTRDELHERDRSR